MITETTFELAVRGLVPELRRHYTDESVDRLLADAEAGRREWRDIYDVFCGALLDATRTNERK